MRKVTKYLIIAYLSMTFIKILAGLFIPTISIYSDEYLYMKLSQSIADSRSYGAHSMPLNVYPPIYPMILVLANMIKTPIIAYTIAKILNALISTTLIFPAFFLLKKFLKSNQALMGALITSFHPSSFAFAPYIMSENLFYPLFLTTILAIYHAAATQQTKFNLLAGVLIGLASLTRTIGLILIPVYLITQIVQFKKPWASENKSIIKKSIISFIVTLVIIIPWLYYNISLNATKPLGNYTTEATTLISITAIPQFLLWIILYTVTITLSTAIIFPAATTMFIFKTKTKQEKTLAIITATTILFFLAAGANHSLHSNAKIGIEWIIGRPIGRYIDTIAPLIIITGFLAMKTMKKKVMNKAMTTYSFIAAAATPLLMKFNLGPVNNLSLSLFEALKRILANIKIQMTSTITSTIATIAIIVAAITLPKIKTNHLLALATMFFILTSAAAYAGTYTNAQIWDNHPQITLSRWMYKNIPPEATITIDKEGCIPGRFKNNPKRLCNEAHFSSVLGTWIRNPIKVSDNQEGEYFVSTREFPLEIVKQEGDIIIYKNE